MCPDWRLNLVPRSPQRRASRIQPRSRRTPPLPRRNRRSCGLSSVNEVCTQSSATFPNSMSGHRVHRAPNGQACARESGEPFGSFGRADSYGVASPTSGEAGHYGADVSRLNSLFHRPSRARALSGRGLSPLTPTRKRYRVRQTMSGMVSAALGEPQPLGRIQPLGRERGARAFHLLPE
jgi:hypothetical protein